MSFDWNEYLSIAEALCGMPITGAPAGSEARHRTAVSRAYYAGFISARNHLRGVDRVEAPLRVSPHAFVPAYFMDGSDPRRENIGRELLRLRTARNRCDYEDVVPQLAVLARISVARAIQVLSDLRELHAGAR
jgi:hypothetical protein